MRLGIMASGRGSNARAILEAVREGRLQAEVPALVCNRAGAGVLDVARDFGVPAHLIVRGDFPTRTAQQRRMLEVLQDDRVDTIALAGFSAIFRPFFLEAFPHRILNIHPSLLPAFGGTMAPRPQADALAAGVKLSGCTVHLVTEDVDSGPIVAQASVCVRPDDTVDTLAARILEQEHRIYPEALQWFADGRVRVVDGIARVDPPVTAA
ncbi:MAG: phosphoribosylglycinamide formyltransferase [Chloroflexota bacterium]|nr:phosphoribosylglycinamide formyltransferase [Chloroflexota bacterium]